MEMLTAQIVSFNTYARKDGKDDSAQVALILTFPFTRQHTVNHPPMPQRKADLDSDHT